MSNENAMNLRLYDDMNVGVLGRTKTNAIRSSLWNEILNNSLTFLIVQRRGKEDYVI